MRTTVSAKLIFELCYFLSGLAITKCTQSKPTFRCLPYERSIITLPPLPVSFPALLHGVGLVEPHTPCRANGSPGPERS